MPSEKRKATTVKKATRPDDAQVSKHSKDKLTPAPTSRENITKQTRHMNHASTKRNANLKDQLNTEQELDLDEEEEEEEKDEDEEDETSTPPPSKKKRKSSLKPKSKKNSDKLQKPNLNQAPPDRGIPSSSVFPAAPRGSIISPETLDFMDDIKDNNDREWMWTHEKEWNATKTNFLEFVDYVVKEFRKEDRTLPDLPAKELMFRINRDVRFSNDRSPYKTFLAAAFSVTGRKGSWCHYYIHLEPNNKTHISAGLWNPPSPILSALRTAIAQDPAPLRDLLASPVFVTRFGGLPKMLESAAEHGALLVTAPKGYAKDHPEIELLRLKSFFVTSGPLDDDAEVMQAGFPNRVIEELKGMMDFVGVINAYLRPHLGPTGLAGNQGLVGAGGQLGTVN